MGKNQKKFQRLLRRIIITFAIAVVYFVAAKLGLKLAFVNASATAVWPPTGIGLATLILWGYGFWPAIFLGAFFANVTTAGTIITSLIIATGNTLESVAGAYLVNRFASGKQALEKPVDIYKFVLLAGIFATVISATIGVTTLNLGGFANWNDYLRVWLTWWLGDMAGALVVAPFLILWVGHRIYKPSAKEILELFSLLVSVLILCWVVFSGFLAFPFFLFTALMWAAFRFGRRGVASIVLIIAAIALVTTLHGIGPFVAEGQNESLLLVQIFIIITVLVCLPVAAEVSLHQQAEEDLRNKNKQLALEKATDDALLASIGDAMVATDGRGRITLVNPAFEQLLGLSKASVLGKSNEEIIIMQDEKGQAIAEKRRPLSLVLAKGKKISATYYLVRKDNSRFPAAVTATPVVLDNKIIGGIKILHDVTREMEIDRAKTEFVTMASHQLRTPLTVVKWYVGALLNGLPTFKKAELKNYLQEISYTNKNMIELVNAILNASRIELGNLAVEPSLVQLPQLLDEVIAQFSVRLRDKQIDIQKRYSNVPALNLDRKLMKVVFENLLSNAVKYTPTGGWIKIELGQKDKQVLVQVSDSGIGIPEGQKNKIFEKMFRAENAITTDPGGTGLGLYIVKAVLEKTGGRVELKSELNKGTTFYVYLPMSGMKRQEGGKGLVPT